MVLTLETEPRYFPPSHICSLHIILSLSKSPPLTMKYPCVHVFSKVQLNDENCKGSQIDLSILGLNRTSGDKGGWNRILSVNLGNFLVPGG